MSQEPNAGDLVACRTADDRWVPKRAASNIVRGASMAVVMVHDLDQESVPYGWPADEVLVWPPNPLGETQ